MKLTMRIVLLCGSVALGLLSVRYLLVSRPAVQAGLQQLTYRPGGTRVVMRGDFPVQLPQQPSPAIFDRALTFSHFEVAVEGKQVTVTGAVDVYDKVPGIVYVWSVRVFLDKKKTIYREHHYEEAANWLEAGRLRMQPTFSDTFPLEPGDYRVELTLYAVPPNFSFVKVKRGANLKMTTIANVSSFKWIRVSG